MTKQLHWLLLLLIGLLACAGTQEVAPPTAQPSTATTQPPPATATSAAQAAPVGQSLHGYLNVAYTQADGDLIGKTQRAQLLNIYATW